MVLKLELETGNVFNQTVWKSLSDLGNYVDQSS